jgi:hypothetical protein
MPSIINATTTTGVAVTGDTSGALALQTNNGTTAVTIDTSQNVGIGTTSPTSVVNGKTLQISASSRPRLYTTSTGSNAVNTFFGSSDDLSCGQIDVVSNHPLVVYTNDTERMRITSAGQALFGATSLLGSRNSQVGININGKDDALFIQNYGSGIGWGITMRPSSSSSGGNGDCFNFTNTSFTTVGTIATSSSATAYNTSSDYRLKENIAPMIGALNTVSQLKPCTYTWKADGKDGQGFIAHELQAVIPDAVTGEKDAMEAYKDDNGVEQTRIKPQGIDVSFLVATLTAAIQELNAKVEAQAVRIAELEGAK